MNAEEQLTQLRGKRERIKETKVRAETRVEGARKRQKSALEKLEKLGITDPKTIPKKLKEFEGQAAKLLTEIDEGVPEQYREADV